MGQVMDDITLRVNDSLEIIRPYLKADGGDISLVEVTVDYTAVIKLHGACTHCSMSHMTMKAGVEAVIKSNVPEILEVRAVQMD